MTKQVSMWETVKWLHGRVGKISETFQLSVEKALRAEGANYRALHLQSISKENFQVKSNQLTTLKLGCASSQI